MQGAFHSYFITKSRDGKIHQAYRNRVYDWGLFDNKCLHDRLAFIKSIPSQSKITGQKNHNPPTSNYLGPLFAKII
jgi:hypothetical protein